MYHDEKVPQPALASNAPRNIDGKPSCRYACRVILKWLESMKSTTNKDMMLLIRKNQRRRQIKWRAVIC